MSAMGEAQAQFTMLAEGVPGSEGPVLDTHGRFYFVAPAEGSIRYLDDNGAQQELANTGGKPAGLQVTADNRIWVADMDLGVLRVSPDGTIEHTVSEYEGEKMRGCNDCALDSQGNLYITAPAGSKGDNRIGEVYCRLTDGTVTRLDGGYAFSNGLAVRADDALLVVAETFTKRLWAYDISEPGVVGEARLFATLTGEHKGGPDGMDYDIDGNLLVTNHGGSVIEVFNPSGDRFDTIDLPFDKPSNLHFGGEDGRDLYITEHTHNAIWKTRWRRPGLIRFPG